MTESPHINQVISIMQNKQKINFLTKIYSSKFFSWRSCACTDPMHATIILKVACKALLDHSQMAQTQIVSIQMVINDKSTHIPCEGNVSYITYVTAEVWTLRFSNIHWIYFKYPRVMTFYSIHLNSTTLIPIPLAMSFEEIR